jgi:hypothetical protein
VTGAAGAVAMAWTDLQACPGCVVREVFLTVVGPAGGRPSGEIQVSEASSTPKSYPHVVFDGQAIAVAWLEYLSQTSSTVKLRRFSPTLQPLGPPLDVAPGGVSRPLDADIDMVAAGPGDYGIAIAVTNGRQSFSHVTCTAN